MCHIIYSRESGNFGFFEGYLIGDKVFKTDPFRIVSPLYNHKFKFNYTATGLCCKEEPVEQEIEFEIGVDDTRGGKIKIPIRRQDLKAGMHIFPLFGSSGNMKDYTDVEIPSYFQIDSFYIPVFFTPESIVFCDGYDVSVDCFYIANPSLFSNWLIPMQSKMEWTETYLDKFTKWYENIYEWIEKSIYFQQDENRKG